jgi:porin
VRLHRGWLGSLLLLGSAVTTAQSTPNAQDICQNSSGIGPGASKYSLWQPDPLCPILSPVAAANLRLKKATNLNLKASYTFLYQYATVTPDTRHGQISARLDFQGDWTAHTRGKDSSSFTMLLRSGTNIGQSQQWNLSDSLGSILGLNSLQGGGAQRPITINLLYFRQTWAAQRVALYIGKLHPNQHIGLSPVNNDETSQFLGGPFDGNPSEPRLGTYAPGAAIEIGPPNGFYTHALIVDAEAKPWTGTQTLFDGHYYESWEVGWKSNMQTEQGRNIRAAVWHNDTKELGRGTGVGIGADWEFNNGWLPFGRWGINAATGSTTKQVETIGLANVAPFGRKKADLFGAASTWTRPSTPGQRLEELTEFFYRLKLSDSLEFSPDVEWLRHPSIPNKINQTAVLGVRLKVIF